MNLVFSLTTVLLYTSGYGTENNTRKYTESHSHLSKGPLDARTAPSTTPNGCEQRVEVAKNWRGEDRHMIPNDFMIYHTGAGINL
jgi:hypothetical protein